MDDDMECLTIGQNGAKRGQTEPNGAHLAAGRSDRSSGNRHDASAGRSWTTPGTLQHFPALLLAGPISKGRQSMLNC